MGTLSFTTTFGTVEGTVDFNTFTSISNVAPYKLEVEATWTPTVFNTAAPASESHWNEGFHDLHFEYEVVGLSGSFTKPTDLESNGARKYTAQAPNSVFVIEDAGTYTVQLTVTDPSTGDYAAVSKSVTVQSLDSFYSLANRIYYSPTSNFPAGAVETFTDLATAMTRSRNIGADSVVYIERGTSTTLSVDIDRDWPQSIHVEAYGEGASVGAANPILLADEGGANSTIFDIDARYGYAFQNGPFDFRLRSVDLNGTWDTVTEETSGGPTVGPGIGVDLKGAAYAVYVDVSSTGLGQAFTAAAQGTTEYPQQMHMWDCLVTDWQNFASYFDNGTEDAFEASTGLKGRVTVTGCSFVQNQLASAGGPKTTNPWYNNHGPARYNSPHRCLIRGSRFGSNTGWSSGDPPQPQPCVRLFVRKRWDDHITCVTDSVFEGGNYCLSFATGNVLTSGTGPINGLVARNKFIGSAETSDIIAGSSSGLTIENNLAVMPDIPKRPNSLSGMFYLEYVDDPVLGGPEPIAELSRNKIRFNTITVLRDLTENGSIVPTEGRYESGTYVMENENNVLYFPNMVGEGNVTANIDTTTVSVVSTYQNGLFTRTYPSATDTPPNDANPDTQYVPTASELATYELQAGNSLKDVLANTAAPYTDITGNARSASTSHGCWD